MTDPPMTDAPLPTLEGMVGHLLRRASQRHNSLWAAQVGPQPTSTQYSLLRAVVEEPGLDQRRAGELASLDRSSTMDVVARLERQGWLTRARHPDDGRRDVLQPGPDATAAMARLAPPVARVQAELLDPVPNSRRSVLLGHLAAVARLDPATPDASPQRVPGHLVRRAQQFHTALFAERIARTPAPILTGPQFAVLLAVRMDAGLSQAHAGIRVALEKSTIADVAERLAERGWLVRQRDPGDGRRRILTLTAEGSTALATAAPVVSDVQRELLQPILPTERVAFHRDLQSLAYGE